MFKTLKIRKVGGKVFPSDFNWECPFCGYENRAFQLPSTFGKVKSLLTVEQIKSACQNCSKEV